MSDLRDALERLARAADEMDGEFGGERLDELRDAREAALAVLASHPVSSPSPEARTEEPINQCDGCRRRLPLNEHGTHVNPDGSYDRIGCTANRYRAPSPVQGEAPDPTRAMREARACDSCRHATPRAGGRIDCQAGRGFGIDAKWCCGDYAEPAPAVQGEAPEAVCPKCGCGPLEPFVGASDARDVVCMHCSSRVRLPAVQGSETGK